MRPTLSTATLSDDKQRSTIGRRSPRSSSENVMTNREERERNSNPSTVSALTLLLWASHVWCAQASQSDRLTNWNLSRAITNLHSLRGRTRSLTSRVYSFLTHSLIKTTLRRLQMIKWDCKCKLFNTIKALFFPLSTKWHLPTHSWCSSGNRAQF